MERSGYNIVVSGPPSSGRSALVRLHVEQAAAAKAPAPDWCYVYNFDEAYRPRAVPLPPGLGDDLQRDLEEFVETVREDLPQAFETDDYAQRLQRAIEPIGKRREAVLEALNKTAEESGFLVNLTPSGLASAPRGSDGQPMAPEAVAQLPEEAQRQIEERAKAVQEAASVAIRELRRLEREAREATHETHKEAARFVTGPLVEELRAKYDHAELRGHFQAIGKDVEENVDRLRQAGPEPDAQAPVPGGPAGDARDEIFKRYGVNLFVTRGDEPQNGAPIVEERQPTFYNLFGRLDYQARFGSLSTDFTLIRPGAVHRAIGGYLILQIEDLFQDPRSWLKLKRTLKSAELRVEDIGDFGPALPTVNLMPQPIPADDLTVVLIGPPGAFAILDATDPDFGTLFKIRAEFEPDIPNAPEAIRSYSEFVCKAVGDCELRHFDQDALREILRQGSRLAGRQDRLTARFGAIQDLCEEADQFAENDGANTITGGHVRQALAAQTRRAGLVPDRMRKMITDGALRIETTGARVGQVNGLAVYQVGGRGFGTPTRITCRTGAGTAGVVNIERQVERSGAIHSKGVLVLSGFLMGTFGGTRPLSFSASVTFEQSYDEVDGDSASSAELYAILTALADVPIRQDIAVTGSVDQFGNIQPVGGVTEKIEGFFDVCRARGLTGDQGVIIPSTNTVNLLLKNEIVDAVDAGQFHIWSVARIEQGLELLTGLQAGQRDDAGAYPAGSILHRVSEALERMRPAVGVAVKRSQGAGDADAGADPTAAAASSENGGASASAGQ